MKTYLMRIMGAVLISVFTEFVLPKKWSKYTKIITGLIIITAITSPLEKTFNLDFKKFFYTPEKLEINAEEYFVSLIKEELEKTVENDIKQRMSDEFKKEISADVSVSINEENKISGILSINLIGDVSDTIIDRINEIYAPKEVLINGF